MCDVCDVRWCNVRYVDVLMLKCVDVHWYGDMMCVSVMCVSAMCVGVMCVGVMCVGVMCVGVMVCCYSGW